MFDELFFNGYQSERTLVVLKALERLKRQISQSFGHWHRKTLYHLILKLIARLKARYHFLIQRFHALLLSRKESWDHFKRLDNSRWQYQQEVQSRRYKKNFCELFSTSIPSLKQYRSISRALNTEFDAHYHRVYTSLKQRFEQEQIGFYYRELRQKGLLLRLHSAYQAGETLNLSKLEDEYRLIFDKKQLESSQIALQVAKRIRTINNIKMQPTYDEAQLRQKAHTKISQAAAVIAQIALLGAIKNRPNNAHELFVFRENHTVKKGSLQKLPPTLESLSKQQQLIFSKKLNALHSHRHGVDIKPELTPVLFSKPEIRHLIATKKKAFLSKFRT